MENEKDIKEIVRSEYVIIEKNWMNLHIISHAMLSVLATISEIVMFFVLVSSGFGEIDPNVYILKYVIAPTSANAILVLSSFFLANKTRIPYRYKYYIVSLSFTLSAFVISVVHCMFSVIYVVFILPIIMTTIYGAQKLTAVTSFSSFILSLLSSVFITWDNGKTHDSYYMINMMVGSAIVLCVYVCCVIIIYYEKKKHEVIVEHDVERQRLQIELFRDDLTGVQNKLAFRDIMNKVESCGVDLKYYLVMYDIDNFKLVNDRYGHLKGDEILREFGMILRKNTDKSAIPFRFGGDEFSILFDGVPLHRVIENTKEIQRFFNELDHPEFEGLDVTVSAGISAFHRGMSAHQFIENADEALYQSKTLSKNRVSVYKPETAYKSSYLAKKSR